MQTVVNKTFDEIAPGDAASVERTLQAGDVRAWAAAFGEGDLLAGPDESQAAAGIVTAHADRAGRFSPSGAREFDPLGLGADQGCIADRRRDDGTARGAGETAGSGDRRAGWPMHRPDRGRS